MLRTGAVAQTVAALNYLERVATVEAVRDAFDAITAETESLYGALAELAGLAAETQQATVTVEQRARASSAVTERTLAAAEEVAASAAELDVLTGNVSS